MKIQNIYHLLQAALLLLLVSCTQEEFPAVQDKAQQLTISVTDGGYTSAVENMKTRVETRAVENGYTTEFTEGDACGFYMVRGGKPVYSNVKLTAEKDAATGGIMWKTDGTTLAAGMDGESYYLYYPYQADMAGKTATPAEGAVMTDAEFFKPLIDGWQPGDDQSTHAAYTASDLMTAGGSTTGTGNTIHLSFAMKHRMALAVIEMPKTVYKFIDANVPDYTVGAEATFTGTAKPLRMADGTYRYLVHSSMPTIEGCYDGGNREFTITTSASHPVVGEYKKTHSEETASTSDDDPAKALRKTIGRYNSLLVLLQGVIELDAQFKDAVFIDFWQRYCNIYRSIFEQKDSIGSIHTTFDGEIGLLVSDEVEIEEPQEQDDAPENSRSKKNTGENRGGLASIFDTLARLNATEQEREQEIQFYFTKTNEFYEFLKSDGRFMAMLRSPNFSRDEIEKEYNKLIRRFLRQAEDVKIKKLIDENKEMFLEDFKNKIVNE